MQKNVSVRNTICRTFDCFHGSVSIPHIVVQPPSMEAMSSNSKLRELLFQVLQRAKLVCSEEGVQTVSHWLQIIPEQLQCSEESIVNYLGMVIAIDFRHWGEKGNLAKEGEPVEGLTPFYCVGSALTMTRAEAQHMDQQCTAPKVDTDTFMIRGSAAMMFLLRRAVEEQRILWYDPDYLLTLTSQTEAMERLKPCFMGCEVDGVTPMVMPAMEERVRLLLSLAKVLKERRTSFFHILTSCEGFLFKEQESSSFIHQLVSLHDRYKDFGKVCFQQEKEEVYLPILKLSQLTALAIIEALKAFWRQRPEGFGRRSDSPCWLWERSLALISDKSASLFFDEEELSLCCDYQIPKALNACGLIIYDAHLEDSIHRNVLLSPSGSDEVAIRVATLVAGEMMLQFLNENTATLAQKFAISLPTEIHVTNKELDYALWLMGRTMKLNHHLCRTIMY